MLQGIILLCLVFTLGLVRFAIPMALFFMLIVGLGQKMRMSAYSYAPIKELQP